MFWLLSWWRANKNNWDECGGKGCMYIKDWFKPLFTPSLTWLLIPMVDLSWKCYWPSNAYGQSQAHLTQSVAVGLSPVLFQCLHFAKNQSLHVVKIFPLIVFFTNRFPTVTMYESPMCSFISVSHTQTVHVAVLLPRFDTIMINMAINMKQSYVYERHLSQRIFVVISFV